MSAYYVPPRTRQQRDPISLQIRPLSALELPVGFVFSPSSQPCVQNTGPAEWLTVMLWSVGQLPQDVEPQKTPKSGNGLGKGLFFGSA